MTQAKYYGQFNPPVDQFLYLRYFAQCNTVGTAIECGAYDGLAESSCKFFEESLGWSTVNVEASPLIYARLLANRPNSINFNCGLANKQEILQFTHAIHPVLGHSFGNGSFRHVPEHKAELDQQGCRYETYEVETITWDQLIQRSGVEKVELFVLDVEGYELEVLQSMQGHTTLPDIICVEYGQLGFEVIYRAIKALGYTFDVISHANAFFIKTERLTAYSLQEACVDPLAFENQQLIEAITSLEKRWQNHKKQLQDVEQAIYRSLSWKLTAPLRRISALLRPKTRERQCGPRIQA